MIAECPACKKPFQLPDEGQGDSARQSLCPACLTAHIEKLIHGQSMRSSSASLEAARKVA